MGIANCSIYAAVSPAEISSSVTALISRCSRFAGRQVFSHDETRGNVPVPPLTYCMTNPEVIEVYFMKLYHPQPDIGKLSIARKCAWPPAFIEQEAFFVSS